MTESVQALPSFADPDVQRCPFAAYDELRDAHPVYRDPRTGHYVLTRYEDVRKILLDPRRFKSSIGRKIRRPDSLSGQIFRKKGWLPPETLGTNDPPSHKTYRALVDKVFTPVRVAALEPRIAEIVADLIDALPPRGEIEFLDAFAIRLPMQVIAEQLGVAARDMDRFKIWSDVAVETNHPLLTEEREVEIAHILLDMQHYMANEVERVRREPNDRLISHLSNMDVDGRQLDMAEMQGLIQQILVAGNETTTTTLASGMKILIEQPMLAEALYAHPERVKPFVEEVLRAMAPVQTLMRKTAEEVVLGDVVIPAGAMVEVRFGAANRDPAHFAEPDRIDLDRANARSHLAFGAGIHLCIGNQLARAELVLAFTALTRRLCDFRAARGEDSYAWVSTYIAYGPARLHMTFDRRPGT